MISSNHPRSPSNLQSVSKNNDILPGTLEVYDFPFKIMFKLLFREKLMPQSKNVILLNMFPHYNQKTFNQLITKKQTLVL